MVSHGDIKVAQGNWQQAAELYQQALKLNPKEPAALNGIGRTLMQQGKHREATDLFFEATQLEPTNPHYFINAAESLFAQGRRSEAVLWAKQAIERGIKEHPILEKLGLKP